MTTWRDFFYKYGNEAEHYFDDLKLGFRDRMGWKTNIHICPYMSFGNQQTLFVKGRVMHDRGIEMNDRDELWDNLVNMYKRFNSHEIKGAKLRVTFGNVKKDFFTDEDGYFGESIDVQDASLIHDVWCYPQLELIEAPLKFEPPVTTFAKVLIPPSSARFGIISDIDDTILKTDATSIMKTVYNTFTNNSHTRIPFHGVASFYRALQNGAGGDEKNPFFYISSSPWNLYDLITDFMVVNSIPEGPVFLKDYGFTHQKLFSDSHGTHKIKKIKKVMDAFPEMKFILAGDSGQKDPEIYSEIARLYPGRILAIYIRDVTMDERDREVETVFNSLKTDLVYSENSYTAAQHAASRGYIDSATLPEILKAKENDVLFEE